MKTQENETGRVLACYRGKCCWYERSQGTPVSVTYVPAAARARNENGRGNPGRRAHRGFVAVGMLALSVLGVAVLFANFWR